MSMHRSQETGKGPMRDRKEDWREEGVESNREHTLAEQKQGWGRGNGRV